MSTRTITAILTTFAFVILAMPAPAQEATLSLSGSGKGPIEVRDGNGKILQVVNPKDMRLNQPSPKTLEQERLRRENAAERLQAHRERREGQRQAKIALKVEQSPPVEKTLKPKAKDSEDAAPITAPPIRQRKSH